MFTEELQLQGDLLDKHLTFAVGGFYLHQQPTSAQTQQQVSYCPAIYTDSATICHPTFRSYQIESQSKALFGQFTLDMGAFSSSLESLRLTGGYRYTWDSIDAVGNNWSVASPTLVRCVSSNSTAPTVAGCEFTAALRTKAPTWNIGLDYKPMSNLLLFGKISRGYKQGGFNVGAVRVETRTFTPEYVKNYEAGFKSDWKLGDVPLRFNLTAYKMDYKDIQLAAGDFNGTTGAAGSQTIQGDARIRGIEGEASIRPIPALTLGGNFSYTDAKWTGGVYLGLPYGVAKWIYSVNASLDLPIPESMGKANLFASYSYTSSKNNSLEPKGSEALQPGSLIAPFGLLNLSARWKNIANSRIDAELFANNVTNKLYVISNSNIFQYGYWAEIYGAPRMYGLRVRYNFGN